MAQMDFVALDAFLTNRGFTRREVWKAIGIPDGMIDRHIVHNVAQMFGMTGDALERAVAAFHDAPPASVVEEVLNDISLPVEIAPESADTINARLALLAEQRGDELYAKMQQPGFNDAMSQVFAATSVEFGEAAVQTAKISLLDPVPEELEPIFETASSAPGLAADEVEIVIDDEPDTVVLPVVTVTIPALPSGLAEPHVTAESVKPKPSKPSKSKGSKPKKKPGT